MASALRLDRYELTFSKKAFLGGLEPNDRDKRFYLGLVADASAIVTPNLKRWFEAMGAHCGSMSGADRRRKNTRKEKREKKEEKGKQEEEVPAYPSIAHGTPGWQPHPSVKTLWLTEKMDGSSFSAKLSDDKTRVICANHGKIKDEQKDVVFRKAIVAMNSPGMIARFVQHAPNLVIHGECFHKNAHNVVKYQTLPPRYVVVFDVQFQSGDRQEKWMWMDPEQVASVAASLGLASAPILTKVQVSPAVVLFSEKTHKKQNLPHPTGEPSGGILKDLDRKTVCRANSTDEGKTAGKKTDDPKTAGTKLFADDRKTTDEDTEERQNKTSCVFTDERTKIVYPSMYQLVRSYITKMERGEWKSLLGGEPPEGIVLKPTRFKYVCKQFTETHHIKRPPAVRMTPTETLLWIGEHYDVPARGLKAIAHLKDAAQTTDLHFFLSSKKKTQSSTSIVNETSTTETPSSEKISSLPLPLEKASLSLATLSTPEPESTGSSKKKKTWMVLPMQAIEEELDRDLAKECKEEICQLLKLEFEPHMLDYTKKQESSLFKKQFEEKEENTKKQKEEANETEKKEKEEPKGLLGTSARKRLTKEITGDPLWPALVRLAAEPWNDEMVWAEFAPLIFKASRRVRIPAHFNQTFDYQKPKTDANNLIFYF